MKKYIILLMLLISNAASAQYNLTDGQKYFLQELRDANFGRIYYAYNIPKANVIYRQLVSYSNMDYYIVLGQTFNWGQAHNGGIIIIDYSSINKNANILAFMFAHEWGHQALGHQENIYHPSGSNFRFKTSATQYEDEADIYAGKFLASYGYDINIVCNYLNALPENDDHTHSTGGERAALVREGYRYIKRSSGGEHSSSVRVACQHQAHPDGHSTACIHPLHSYGDLIACVHVCNGYYGNTTPCHPNGDLIPCAHAMHSNGDWSACNHRLHPDGDIKMINSY
ncbi:hypothetical protein HDE68_002816 [Pedobacter cryoconitis]|uniref:IrrE N-terminal-like domain-containing protein n=2 Tax=Pedobacter cryoconitis TaxID=188932 RepID=A0A7W8ZMT7_9SPHI|nr:hypothetical protein [Pedobacter cryoconitis]MBB5636903.1 hypothetical protein [Pedobacter cryoconitis]